MSVFHRLCRLNRNICHIFFLLFFFKHTTVLFNADTKLTSRLQYLKALFRLMNLQGQVDRRMTFSELRTFRVSGQSRSRGDNEGEDCVRLCSGPSVAARLRSAWVPREKPWLPLGLQSWGNLQSCSYQGPSHCQWSMEPPSPQSL